jgi:hypothetical protein
MRKGRYDWSSIDQSEALEAVRPASRSLQPSVPAAARKRRRLLRRLQGTTICDPSAL